MDDNQKIFVECQYIEPYDATIYTDIVTIEDWELSELLNKKLGKNKTIKDYKLFVLQEVGHLKQSL